MRPAIVHMSVQSSTWGCILCEPVLSDNTTMSAIFLDVTARLAAQRQCHRVQKSYQALETVRPDLGRCAMTAVSQKDRLKARPGLLGVLDNCMQYHHLDLALDACG